MEWQPIERDLRAANISGGARGWAIINSKGRFGDVIVAGSMNEHDARICLVALSGGPIDYNGKFNQYEPSQNRIPPAPKELP